VTLREPAWAKVNLFLQIVGRRPDGYHLLDSLAVFPAIGDVVSAEPADAISLSLTGSFGASLVAEPDNLVLRAARALQQLSGISQGAALTLEKNLPIASGIGGGSADAAAALRVLSRLWNLPATTNLHDIAKTLGADVPVCLAQHPARMQGVGEILSPSPRLPDGGIVLINPGIAVATPAVFRARTGGFRPEADLPPTWHNTTEMTATLATLHNDLQAPAIALCPQIADVLAALDAVPTCQLARMSGSGATCFGIFPNTEAAQAAASTLERRNWWVWGGAIKSPQPAKIPGLPDQGSRP
jgi:4-diphosphocytidyl-2-C-methyl-D-erythritol kinase